MLGDTISVTNMTYASQHGHGVDLGSYSIIFCLMFIRYNRIAAPVHLVSDRRQERNARIDSSSSVLMDYCDTSISK